MNGEIQELHDLKTKVEGKVVQFKVLLAKKDENVKSIVIELERAQKMPRLLNNGKSKLDHLITTSRSFGDQVVLGIKVSHLVLRLFLLNLVCLMIPLMFLLMSPL